MITPKEAMESPELMIKHKEDLKDERIFDLPWYRVFEKHPYLYREFSDRFDEMWGWDVHVALNSDPTLILDLKEYLYKPSRFNSKWTAHCPPELSLCIKYKDDVDKFEAAYYITFPYKLDGLDKEERREMSKRIIELLKEISKNNAKKGKGHGKR
jgi:hypothetical protein